MQPTAVSKNYNNQPTYNIHSLDYYRETHNYQKINNRENYHHTKHHDSCPYHYNQNNYHRNSPHNKTQNYKHYKNYKKMRRLFGKDGQLMLKPWRETSSFR